MQYVAHDYMACNPGLQNPEPVRGCYSLQPWNATVVDVCNTSQTTDTTATLSDSLQRCQCPQRTWPEEGGERRKIL